MTFGIAHLMGMLTNLISLKFKLTQTLRISYTHAFFDIYFLYAVDYN